MGIADIIPGVSGGTVAFLTGIYEELIESISSFDRAFLKTIAKGQIQKAFSKTNWKFLIILVSGILSALFSLSHPLRWLLKNYPSCVYAFFFGIILTTIFILARKIRKKSFMNVTCGLASAFVMFLLTNAMPAQTPDAGWFLFISGALAICAMILPGISGAFILLLLGKYEFLIHALSNRDFGVLLIVGAGCITGLLTFVRLLRWFFHHHADLTLSVLTGMVLGSLWKIWPWKKTILYKVGPDEMLIPHSINIIPKAVTPEILAAVLLILAGAYAGFFLGRTGEKISDDL